MSNTDFDPDAYLSGPAATPAPPPAAPAATPAPKQDSGFDPNAYLAQPAGGFDPDAYLKSPPTGNAITDIWPEEKRAATDTWQSVKAGLGPENTEQAVKESQSTPFWDLTPAINSTLRTGRAIGSALAYPFQAVVGAPARSLIGHPLASAEQALGTNVDPQKFKSLIDAGVPKDEAVARATETPQQSYERWRGNVDTALSAIKPAGAPVVSAQDIGWRGPPVKPTPAPTPPVEGPFGVTLSQGEEANDLAARVQEQNFLREGSAGAQPFREQREAQLSAAPERGAAALDTTNQVIANSPQTAADIVTSGLTQHQDVVDKLISTSEQALNGMHEANRTALSPTGTVLAQNPMDAANIIQGSVANEADRIQQAKSAAYAALDDSGTQFHPAAFNNAADKIRTMVEKSEKVDINPDSTPIANRVLDKLDSIVQDITQQRDPDTGRILTSDPITPSSLEEVRKRLNVFMGEARASAQMGKPSDAIAMRGIIDAWDGLIEDRIVKGTVTQGNPLDALSQMRYARGLNTTYRQTFMPRGPGDDVGQAIQKILGRYEGSAATPEQIQGMMYSPTNPLAVRIAGRLKQMFTSNSPEFGAAKQGLYSTITERPPGAPKWEPEDVANRIDQFTKGQGRSLTQAYLEPDEIARLQDFGKRLRAHANATELAENPFEGVDFTQVFRRAVNGDQKAVKQLEDATSRLQAVGGPDSPHALALKQGLFLQGIQPVPGVAKWGPKTIGDNLSSLLASTRNSPLYSPAQRGVVQSYVDLMRKIQEPAGIRAPSEPAVRRALSVVGYRTGQIIGALIGRAVTPGIPLIGEFAGITVGGKLERAMEAATLGRVKKQLPILSEQLDRYQKAYTAWQRHQNTGTQKLFGVATSNLANGLHNWGINWTQLPLGLPGTAPAQDQQKRAAGGGVQDEGNSEWDQIINPATGRPRIVITPSAPQSPVETFNGANLGQPSGVAGEGLESTSEGATAPIGDTVPPPVTPDWSTAGFGPAVDTSEGLGNKVLNRLTGAGGEERYQTWPERMIRSGTTLAGDVMSGKEPDYTGLRREDYTDIPVDESKREGGFWPFNKLAPVSNEPQDALIQRAQDMAALAGGAGMPSAEEGALGMAGGKLKTPATAPQPFYSAVEQAITNAPQQKMHGSQWFNWLKNQPGIKQEELDWLGLKDNPDLQGLQTKQQLLDHVQGQGVGLKEVEKGSNLGDTGLDEWITNRMEELQEKYPNRPVERIQEQVEEEALANFPEEVKGTTRYSDYQLPGGDNYRELLLTMPEKTTDPKVIETARRMAKDRGEDFDSFAVDNNPDSARNYYLARAKEASGLQSPAYHSSHWDEPNVLAHLRMNDRDIPGVGKSLHLEELQSDLHQQGRKEGYQTTTEPIKYTLEGNGPWTLHDNQGNTVWDFSNKQQAEKRLQSINNLKTRQEQHKFLGEGQQPGVPDMPFKTTWPDLLLKRAITKAARENYDAVSWTPGKEQAKRYPDMLRQQIREIAWAPASEEGQKVITARPVSGRNQGRDVTFIVDKAGKVVDGHPDTIGKPVDAVFGKGMAEKIMAADRGNLQPSDFVLGGHGMEMFYDKMLVDKANAIGKKYGAKVEWKGLTPEQPVQKLNIHETPLPDSDVTRLPGNWRIKSDPAGGFMAGELHETPIQPSRSNMVWGGTREDAEKQAIGWLNSRAGREYRLGNVQRYQVLDEVGNPQAHFYSKDDAQRYINKINTPAVKVPVLRLTPQLKQQALTRGMPLFSDTSKPGAALSGLEKPDRYGLSPREQERIWAWQSGAGTGNDTWNKLRTDSSLRKTFEKFPVRSGTVYRGLVLPRTAINRLSEGSTFRLDKHSSASTSRELAGVFSDAGLTRNAVLLKVNQSTGRSLPNTYTMNKGEREVVLLKGTKYKVVKVRPSTVSGQFQGSKGKYTEPVTLIELKEVR